MQVQVKLLASLRDRLPREARGMATLDLPAGTTVAQVLERLGIGSANIHVVLVNDDMETDRQRVLNDGDSLQVIPPVHGGCIESDEA